MKMLKIIRLFLTLGFVCLVLFAFTNKEIGIATISQNRCISLNTDSIVYDAYSIDISNLGFNSKIDTEKYFGFISSNLIRFEVDYSHKKAIMFLLKHNLKKKTWEKSDWDNYFLSRCKN